MRYAFKWVRRAETDTGRREGLTTEDRERIKALEREVRELRRANEILRTHADAKLRPRRHLVGAGHARDVVAKMGSE